MAVAAQPCCSGARAGPGAGLSAFVRTCSDALHRRAISAAWQAQLARIGAAGFRKWALAGRLSHVSSNADYLLVGRLLGSTAPVFTWRDLAFRTRPSQWRVELLPLFRLQDDPLVAAGLQFSELYQPPGYSHPGLHRHSKLQCWAASMNRNGYQRRRLRISAQV